MSRGHRLKILVLTLACSLAVASLAGEPRKSADPKQQVLDLEKEWVNAEIKRDSAALRRILDDKFIATFGARQPRDKEAFIKGIISAGVDPTEYQTLTDETVIVDGDTAIVVGTDTLHGTRKGEPYTINARYTITYIRRHGQWLALAEHLVEAPSPK